MNFKFFKLEIFIPESHFKILREILSKVDAGHIGKYSDCLSYSKVTGTWRPLENTNPYIGEQGKLSEETELKVEVTIKAENLSETISEIKKVHPYDEPVINVLPLFQVGI